MKIPNEKCCAPFQFSICKKEKKRKREKRSSFGLCEFVHCSMSSKIRQVVCVCVEMGTGSEKKKKKKNGLFHDGATSS